MQLQRWLSWVSLAPGETSGFNNYHHEDDGDDEDDGEDEDEDGGEDDDGDAITVKVRRLKHRSKVIFSSA